MNETIDPNPAPHPGVPGTVWHFLGLIVWVVIVAILVLLGLLLFQHLNLSKEYFWPVFAVVWLASRLNNW